MPEPFNNSLKSISLPTQLGPVADIAPVNDVLQSVWLVLAVDGGIFQLNAETREFTQVAHSSVPAEPDHEPFDGHALRQRLHASNSGEFVAVVNDYGKYGQVIDLRTGTVTISIDGGDYLPRTVPLSFAFADVGRSVIAIHRTDWNRLDFSDPATGKLLSERGPTSFGEDEERPEHYLDYFHGALYVNPASTRIVDDGWIWHPVGTPALWSLESWFTGNVWESEDGPTRKELCARTYYWDKGLAWLDNDRIAISGIGEMDDAHITDGVRVFDVTKPDETPPRWRRSDSPWPAEVITFPGPAGKFFSDGTSLFSTSETGLERWSLEAGEKTGHLEGFQPTHHHRGARELAQLSDGVLVRWSI